MQLNNFQKFDRCLKRPSSCYYTR